MNSRRLPPRSLKRMASVLAALSGTLAATLALLPSPALAVPQTTEASRMDLSSTALVGGVVVPERSTPLYFSPAVATVGGGRSRRVKSVHVKVGQRVSAGDVLAELDAEDLERRLEEARSALSRALQAQRQAEAARRAQEARLAQLAQEASAAQATAEQAGADAARAQGKCASLAQELVDTVVEEVASLPPATPPSPTSMPRTQAALQALLKCQADLSRTSGGAGAASATAQLLSAQVASLRSSQSQFASASSQVSAAQRNVEQMERLLKAATLAAPYNGLISAVNVGEGNTLPSGVPALEIRSEKLVARADLAEGDLLGVKPGSPAELRIPTVKLELSTTVTSVSEDPRGLNAGGPLTYPAYFELPESAALKPGQLVRAKILVESRRGVVAVPSSAVTESKGLYYVIVVKDGREEIRRVVPGISDENYTEILQGLQPGERVRTLAPQF